MRDGITELETALRTEQSVLEQQDLDASRLVQVEEKLAKAYKIEYIIGMKIGDAAKKLKDREM